MIIQGNNYYFSFILSHFFAIIILRGKQTFEVNDDMKIKPHGAWYLAPFLISFISVIVAVIILAQQAMMLPASRLTEASLNQEYERELFSGDYIALYFEDEGVSSYSFNLIEGDRYLNYTTPQGTFRVHVEIQRVSGNLGGIGYEIENFNSDEALQLGRYKNFADVNITEDGTYRIIYSSDDTIDAGLGFRFVNWTTGGMKIIQAIVLLVIGIPVSILSFVIIIVLRSMSKKKNSSRPTSPKNDTNKQFDY